MLFHLLSFSLFLALSAGICSPAFAQLDPSTEMLLSHDMGDDQKAGLQSGRYEVHPDMEWGAEREPADANTRSSSKATVTKTSTPAGSDFKIQLKQKKVSKKKKQTSSTLPSKKVTSREKDIDEEPGATTVVTSSTMPIIPQPTLPPLASQRVQTTTTTTTMPKVAEKTLAPPTTLPLAATTTEPEIPEPVSSEEEAPGWKEQLKELVYQPKEIQEYKEKIHPDDNRMNQIEINLMPGVLSVNSKSNLDYRDYKTTAPAWLIGGEFWLTPFMGIYGSYTSSVGGDVLGNPSTSDHISAQHEWTEIGFDLRKYFGMSRKANSITYGVDYVSYKFKVPDDSTYREGLNSNAIGFHIESRIPVSPHYAWTFGGRVAPRVNVSEKNTALALSSGSSPQSTKVGAHFGGEFKMSRQSQLVWQLSVSYEKVKYGDQSSLSDPSTGSPIDGVSVDSTTTFLQFGYRWGQ